MRPNFVAGAQIALVAAATMALGLGIIWYRGDQINAIASAATALGVAVAGLTALFSFGRDRVAGHDREHSIEEYRYLALSTADDFIALLDRLLIDEKYRGLVEPPEIALDGLIEVKNASRELALLGDVATAARVDEKLRHLLEEHGSLSWLWFASRVNSPASTLSRVDDTGPDYDVDDPELFPGFQRGGGDSGHPTIREPGTRDAPEADA